MKKKELLKRLKTSPGVYIAIPTNNGNDFTYIKVDANELAFQIKTGENSNGKAINDFWVSNTNEFLWFEIKPEFVFDYTKKQK